MSDLDYPMRVIREQAKRLRAAEARETKLRAIVNNALDTAADPIADGEALVQIRDLLDSEGE